MEEMPTVGRKPPTYESKSERDLHVGRHEGQTAPSKWSRGITGFSLRSWMGKKENKEGRWLYLECKVSATTGGKGQRGKAAGLERSRALEDEAVERLK